MAIKSDLMDSINMRSNVHDIKVNERWKKPYLEARKFTNTVQLFDNANKASLWIDVFGGKTPFANREIMVRGKARSYRNVSHIHKVDFVWDKLLTSTLDPSRDALPGGAGDSSSPFVTVERFDFLPGMVAV